MSTYWENSDYIPFQTDINSLQTSAPIWINRDSNNWVSGSLSSTSPMSTDSISPICSPPDEKMMQCSSVNEFSALPVHVRKIRNVRKSDKHHCSVCGDRPTGYHYDVLSCNGCKTFFRRTIINNRKFSCSKGGNCQFTKDFRCACRSCRFDKCVRVGMNPAAIQFPQKHDEHEEIDSGDDENRHDDKSLALLPFSSISLRENTIKTYRWVDELFRREDAVLKMRTPGCIETDSDVTLTEALRLAPVLGKMPTGHRISSLYQNDRVRYWMVIDLHLLVEFAKTFNVFRELEENDQKCLIYHTGGLLHVATQSFYSYFESKASVLTFPDGTNALANKMTAAKFDSRKQIFVNYYAEMYSQPVWDFLRHGMSMIEFSFFKAISLFSPDNSDMSPRGRSIVNEERMRFTNLLRQYLIAEHGFKAGIQRFSTILMTISTFVTYGEKRRDYITLMSLLKFDIAKIGRDIYLNKPNNTI